MNDMWRMMYAESLLARMIFALDMYQASHLTRSESETIVREAVAEARGLLESAPALPTAYLN
jgi:hypothetical protein